MEGKGPEKIIRFVSSDQRVTGTREQYLPAIRLCARTWRISAGRESEILRIAAGRQVIANGFGLALWRVDGGGPYLYASLPDAEREMKDAVIEPHRRGKYLLREDSGNGKARNE